MNEKKKAPASGATLARAEGGGLSIPDPHCSTTRSRGQGVIIADLLGTGKGEAVPRSQLVEWTGMDPRAVTLTIERERREGTPILANTHGYFLPASREEAAECIGALHHRAKEIFRTAKAIEKATLSTCEGQVQLEAVLPEVMDSAETQSG